MTRSFARSAAAAVSLVACIALAVQYALLLQAVAPQIGAGMTTLRFLSYFTILANGLAAAVTGAVAFGAARWPATARMQGAAALALGVTGVVHALVLAGLLTLTGADWWVDKALHVAMPLLYFGWWLACAQHGRLGWRDVGAWLLFPLLYLLWIAIRATWVERWFPYPFLDIDALGAARVAVNALLVAATFAAGGALLLMFDRWLGRRPR